MESNLWYLDNGASNHMTGQLSKFSELDTKVTGQVKFGDRSMVQIRGKGSIILRCKDGENRTLNEVYYIPSLQSNIISLGQLSKDGYKIVLKGENLWVHEGNGDLLIKVRRSSNRLYKIIIHSGDSKCLMARHDNVSWLWHSRLGHVNFKALKLMFAANMVYGMPKINLPSEICTGCLMLKQVRKAFPKKSSFTAKKALELIHGDLCGPITPCTPGGNKYIFVLIDDYTRVIWTYLLKNKNDAFDAFKRLRALVETSPEKKIITFRTDNGGEFTSREFNQYCDKAGIIRHFSAPYSPQQNGVVERRNRTLIEMSRSLLKEMNMPNHFWGEAVRHATYLINRLPTRDVTGITPYEAWSKEKPHVDHIRVFGCVAYMKMPSVHLKKLDSRSKAVVYLGKEAGTKAFRLYDPKTKTVCISRDVVFEENKAWCWSKETEEIITQLGSFTVASDFQNRETVTGSYPGSSTSNNSHSVSAENSIQNSDVSSSVKEGEMSTENTPESNRSISSSESEDGPRRYRPLSEIYNETERMELEDEELYLMGLDEPVNFNQAVQGNEWKRAMKIEMEGVERNGTWELTELPPGRKPIDLKWIYKIKRDAQGNVVKHKAIIVAKGYVQKQGIDFDEVFTPVTRIETICLLLALAAKENWQVHHFDVKTAFLNGEIKEEVFFLLDNRKDLSYKGKNTSFTDL